MYWRGSASVGAKSAGARASKSAEPASARVGASRAAWRPSEGVGCSKAVAAWPATAVHAFGEYADSMSSTVCLHRAASSRGRIICNGKKALVTRGLRRGLLAGYRHLEAGINVPACPVWGIEIEIKRRPPDSTLLQCVSGNAHGGRAGHRARLSLFCRVRAASMIIVGGK